MFNHRSYDQKMTNYFCVIYDWDDKIHLYYIYILIFLNTRRYQSYRL